jgi:hypothetical protein
MIVFVIHGLKNNHIHNTLKTNTLIFIIILLKYRFFLSTGR